MYQFEWFDEVLYNAENAKNPSPQFKSQVDISNIDKVLFCHWEEHCLECAPPLCFSTCSVYMMRGDHKCRKVYYGVARNKNFKGLFDFGADIKFRKWGKFTTQLYNKKLTVQEASKYDNRNVSLVKTANFVAGALSVFDKTRTVNGAYVYYRHKKLNDLKILPETVFDDFLIECYSFEKEPFRLRIENNKYTEYHYRKSVLVHPGHNLIRIPVKNFQYKDDMPTGSVNIYPENDLEVRLVFTWLDFVKYKTVEKGKTAQLKPAEKIKCIAWDLDNTLWEGVFIESNPAELKINQDALAMIKKLDERGVLQTIVSKNTHDEVWPFIQSLGLEDYFLYPGINWGQKSESLKTIADKLNINVDTFGVIDDSPFERQEISSSLPQVRVYTEKQINDIIEFAELDFPITQESRNRRSYYLVEQKRSQIAESFTGDYNEFLRSCGMALTIFTPKEESEIARCNELIQRTNQLNLSARKYTQPAFDEIIKDDEHYLKFALQVEDQFGAYGIIGFCIVEKGTDSLKIKDFVISCRVAQKMIEDAFVTWLAARYKVKGIKYILADHTKTSKNAKILSVFEAIKFEKEDLGNDNFLLRLDLEKNDLKNDVISVKEGFIL